MVRRHLHDEGRRLLVPQHRHGEDLRQGEHEEQADRLDEDDDDALLIDLAQQGQAHRLVEVDADEQEVQRKFGLAVEHGKRQNRRQLRLLVRDALGGHDRRDGTSAQNDAAQDHRQRGLAVEPKTAQDPVQDERDTRHVAAVLQYGDQREEDEEDRDVVEERVQVVHYPEHELPQQGQLNDSGLGKDALGEAAEPGEDGPRVVGEVVALYKGEIVESVDDEKKEDGAEEPVADQPVYALGDVDLLRVLPGHAAPGDGRGPSAALAGDVEVGAHAPLALERLPQGLRPGQDVLGHLPSPFAYQGCNLRIALHQLDGDPRKGEGPLKGRPTG